MKLTILGSSSNANCYLIHNDTECLVLEAGFTFLNVKNAIDFQTEKIVGVLVTHEHGDHAKYVPQYLKEGTPVFMSQGTKDGLKKQKFIKRPGEIETASLIEPKKQFNLGNFIILPFEVEHDANQPLGFLISHPETGKILFITDTFYCEYTFSGLSHILVEANYCEHILNTSKTTHPTLKKRIVTSHMSLNTCKGILSANSLKDVVNIVLIHLSDRHSDAKQFHNEIAAHTGKPVYIADKGLEISLNKGGF